MKRRRDFRFIAILFTMVMLLGVSAAEARNPRPRRLPRAPRRCHPGTSCQHRSGVCNDAGPCCNTHAGDVACGVSCCNDIVGLSTCCGSAYVDMNSDNANCGASGNVCSVGHTCQNGACVCPEATT